MTKRKNNKGLESVTFKSEECHCLEALREGKHHQHCIKNTKERLIMKKKDKKRDIIIKFLKESIKIMDKSLKKMDKKYPDLLKSSL